MVVQTMLISCIVEAYRSYPDICQRLVDLVVDLLDDCPSDHFIGIDDDLQFCGRFYVPDIPKLR